MPQYHELSERFERGKLLISFLVCAFTLTGTLIDTISLYYEYSDLQLTAQVLLFLIALASIVFILTDSKKHTQVYLILSYSVFANTILTWLLNDNYSQQNEEFKSQLAMRDTFFLLFFSFVTGFNLNKRHYIIQALLLTVFVFVQFFMIRSEFFRLSGLFLVVVCLGSLLLIYFFTAVVNELLEGFKSSIIMSEQVMQMEQSKKAQLIRYNQSVLRLSREDVLYQKGLDYVFHTVCEQAGKEMDISMVSVWLMNEDRSEMIRNYALNEGSKDTNKLHMSRNQHEVYFQALETESVIIASDARNHPYTSVFAEDYFKAFDIFSLLDSPIMIDGKLIGVICCEQKHQLKEWTEEDVLYVRILSEFCAIGFKNEQIKSLLDALSQKRRELEEKNKEISTINEDLQALNDHLSENNGSLEAMVRLRTKVLEQQNEQLMEYAFINSHLLRAPLARIMGLSNLIVKDLMYSVQDQQLIHALQQSSEELDAIIRRISEVLYDGHSFSREDIQEILDRNLNKQKV